MKFFLFIFVSLFTLSAMAVVPGYELTFEVEKTQGKIRLKENQIGTITSPSGVKIQISSKEGEIQGKKGILLDLIMENGSKAKILVEEKKTGEIIFQDKEKKSVSLKVTPTRITFPN